MSGVCPDRWPGARRKTGGIVPCKCLAGLPGLVGGRPQLVHRACGPYAGSPTATRAALQSAEQPEAGGGGGPPRAGRPVRAYQPVRKAGLGGGLPGHLGGHQEEGTGEQLRQRRSTVACGQATPSGQRARLPGAGSGSSSGRRRASARSARCPKAIRSWKRSGPNSTASSERMLAGTLFSLSRIVLGPRIWPGGAPAKTGSSFCTGPKPAGSRRSGMPHALSNRLVPVQLTA